MFFLDVALLSHTPKGEVDDVQRTKKCDGVYSRNCLIMWMYILGLVPFFCVASLHSASLGVIWPY